MSKIELCNVTVNYADQNQPFTALKNINLSIEEGEFVSIIGSSGCGKSTLLRMIEGLAFPTDGLVSVHGKCRGVVFQQYSLFPWMTARKNVAFGIKQSQNGMTRSERLELADTFLEKVGLAHFKNKYPYQLSGGMQQRVAIARALAIEPDLLLMDEPFGAIDAKNRELLQELLLQLWEGAEERQKKTVVFVTHDIDEAIFLSDRIVMLTPSPGTICKVISVPFKRPRKKADLARKKEYEIFRNELFALFDNKEASL